MIPISNTNRRSTWPQEEINEATETTTPEPVEPSPGLDHHDAFGGADHHQIQIAGALLVIGGIDDEVAVHAANTHCADGAVKRNVGDAERYRRAVDAGDIGIVLGVRGEDHGDDLRLAAEAFGKQRADGPVDLAAGQDFTLAGPAFALDEAAGNASRGVGVLAVIDREREKVDALAGLGIGAGRGQDDVVADADDAGAVRLLGQFSGFEANGLAAGQIHADFMFVDAV